MTLPYISVRMFLSGFSVQCFLVNRSTDYMPTDGVAIPRMTTISDSIFACFVFVSFASFVVLLIFGFWPQAGLGYPWVCHAIRGQ